MCVSLCVCLCVCVSLQAKRLEIARKRVQAGKPPFQIHRQVARSSIFQHLLAYEQADKVKETMQLQPLSQPALEQ